ncbi:SusC/RagA family TonB-linked outer membrane protein [Dyadobacter psychrotolerans]|uniref:SusC/RagA family TonB-linked outer membrane protein n=1 Tax=Dyadobacter psychrotolerans TaxID=2541721 RepID=A0A4R5E2G5_9BACT|nr:SusC/RagA family TonB-linked outer membrane protein [Dyadobacter psychrotolerans]TDE18545.1 SusC/RagA family TonB-linked outer membrane protein [Dyadobacter psychrotolerans]
MSKKFYSLFPPIQSIAIFALAMLISLGAFAQSYVIKGKVTDGSGQSVPGVSVQIRGTSQGSISDAEGEYSLSTDLSAGDYSLDFSSVGFKTVTQKLTLGTQTALTINVTISDDIALLDEVIVTGSTIRSTRRQLGNSINSINSTDLQKAGTGNLFSALQGKVPGAQITQNSGDPAGGMTIRLRGIKSLQGSSDPLYVIDGVIVSNSSANVSQFALADQVGQAVIGTNRMADINPTDIESMSIINGAAAAAQYGSRASNGVVLITTKRGKSGAPQVNFSTSLSVNELRKKFKISTYGKQFGFTSLRLGTITGLTAAQIAANPGTTVTRINRDGAFADLSTNQVDVQRYDYQDEIYKTGLGTDNSISVSGGTDKTQYFASLSYLKNQGIIKGTDFQRYGLRVRLEQRLANWAKISAGVTYSNSFSNEKPNGNVFYSPINSINITNNIYDITRRDGAGNLPAVEPTRVNPLTVIEEMKFTQAVNRTVNDLQLNLTPLKGLNIDWIFGIDAFSQLGKNLIPPYPYGASAGLPAERFPNGFAANVNATTFLYNSDINVSYEKDLTPSLKLNVVAGTSYQNSKTDISYGSGQNLSPFIETVSGATSAIRSTYNFDQFDLSGVFAQATLGYKNLLFVTGAVRRDRSSKFSPSESNQTYPKFSASFIPSDLEFWKKASLEKIVNTAKLRYSWGRSGNLTGLGSYDRFWQFQPVPYLGKNTIVPSSTLANPQVRPEFMTENEGGVDLTFLENKLSLGLTAYKQKITDLVVNRVLAPTEGGTGRVDNVGEMENKGFEVSLGYMVINTKDFNWDVNVIYSHNRNKITKLGSPLVALTTVTGAPAYLIEGQAASVFYGTFFAKNADGSPFLTTQNLPQSQKGVQSATNPLDYTPAEKGSNGQFLTNTNVRKIIGNPNPKWTGSFVSNLTYKRLGFRFLLDAVQGVEVFNADRRTRQGVGIGDYSEKELKGELPRGYVYSIYNTEEWRVDDGSFVKLREVSLSYQLPDFMKNVKSINISLTGRNLISWDNYDGYDPETNAGGNSDLIRNVDFGNVPIPRTYQLKVSASF